MCGRYRRTTKEEELALKRKRLVNPILNSARGKLKASRVGKRASEKSADPAESMEVNDARIFAGLWSYLVLGMWGGSTEETGADLTVDPFSMAEKGEVVLTISIFADIGVLWPQVFAFSQANLVTPPP